MGQRDLAQNEYFKDKLRFADVCNGILFQGREVIRPEDLQEREEDIIFYNSQEHLGKIIVDKIMMWHGICINILGVESQTKVDYSMVFRLMKEEALSYEIQWNGKAKEWGCRDVPKKELKYEWSPEGKEARFTPVLLLVIYFGIDKKWDVLTTKLMCDLLGLKHDRIVKKVIEEGKSMCRAVEELMEDARDVG